MPTEENFNEFLDEIYQEYKIGDVVLLPHDILKSCDPTAYQAYYHDWSEGNNSE